MDNENLISIALAFLHSLGVDAYRPSPYQVKFGSINYWPIKGTIQVDGQPRAKEKGLQALGDYAREHLRDYDPFALHK